MRGIVIVQFAPPKRIIGLIVIRVSLRPSAFGFVRRNIEGIGGRSESIIERGS